ncbi:unnamed protein product [Clonostachys rosea f. rosea IK726]|uniref:Uncharacterized protein n=1 Tax=Clonostachys rosea f. rosea IK726 TaxID=1349383 RepID=A0ACA9UFY6_BIOOC|nr:unnamed protein product [Clonostachys rosea f. rosea IK726]
MSSASGSQEPPREGRRASSARGNADLDPVLAQHFAIYSLRPRIRCLAQIHSLAIQALRRAAPTPANVDKALQPRKGNDDYNARAVRHALRVFAVSWLGMKGWDAVARKVKDKDPKSSLSAFATRALLQPLPSPYAPALGASFAGLALGIYPRRQLRVTIAIYSLFRALEFGWNACEAEGLIWGVKNGRRRERPWWFGSWMLQPVAFGQLFHAFVFDRDCLPEPLSKLVLSQSAGYLQTRPQDWPQHLKWPAMDQIVDSLAEMARLSWPDIISPTLFPTKEKVLPPSLASLAPLTSRAHPLISPLSCATLHPSDPSCLRTYLTFWINTFPPLTRVLLLFYSAMTVVPRFKSFYHSPLATINSILASALRMSTFATGALSSAWASICFFQTYLPRHVLATQRYFLGGFFAGLWAWVERAWPWRLSLQR